MIRKNVNMTDETPRTKEEEEIDEVITKLNESLIKDELITTDRYYVDLALLRDIRLGCLFSFLLDMPEAEAKVKYKQIIEKLPQYYRYEFSDITKVFDIGVSYDDYKARLHDPKYANLIYKGAPTTRFVDLLITHLKINVNHSHVAEKYSERRVGKYKKERVYDHIHLVINTYPLQLSKSNRDELAIFYSENLLTSTVVVCIDPLTLSEKTITGVEEFYVLDLRTLVEGPVVKKRLESYEFMDKKIFAFPYFSAERRQDKFSDQKLLEQMSRFRNVLQVLTTFSWVPLKYMFACNYIDE